MAVPPIVLLIFTRGIPGSENSVDATTILMLWVPALKLVRIKPDDASSAGKNEIALMFLRLSTPPKVALIGPTLEPGFDARETQPPPSTFVSIAVMPACA